MGPMPDTTPNIALPFLFAAQAQKHVTLNESLLRLDAVVQLTVLDRDLAAPPGSPADGDRFIIAAGASGAWAGQAAGTIAAWQDGAWAFIVPREGWLAWVADEDTMVAWSGTQWISAAASGPLQNVPLLGVNATADTTNRLAVAAPATLLNNAGAGHQLKINKAAAGDTASFLFQTGFSGRAELGLAGSDDFSFKVSANGSAWTDALVIERANGRISTPQTPPPLNLLVNGDFAINQRAFAGGALAAGAYGYDRWRAGTGGATVTADAAGNVTLTGPLEQVVEAAIFGGLAGQDLTLSLEGENGAALAGDVTIAVGAQSGTITAGAGRRSATVTLGAGETGNITVRLTPVTAATIFRRVQLCVGRRSTPWSPRPPAVELQLCQRYFRRLASSNVGQHFFPLQTRSTQDLRGPAPFPVRMRAAPTFSFSAASDFVTFPGSTITAIALIAGEADQGTIRVTTSSATPTQAWMLASQTTTAWMAFNAEL